MYSSASAESPSDLWIDATCFIIAVASRTSDFAPEMPIDASVRKGLTNRGIRRLPPGLKLVGREDGEIRAEDVVVGENLLGERLVLAERQLGRASARVGEVHQVEQAGHGHVAAEVLAEHLQQVEDEVRLPPASGPSTSLPTSPCTPRMDG